MKQNILEEIGKASFKHIPFAKILLRYTKPLFNSTKLNISEELIHSLHKSLLEELSSYSEISLQRELEMWRDNKNHSFDLFSKNMHDTIEFKFPVLHKYLQLRSTQFINHISLIIDRFQNDRSQIIDVFKIDCDIENLAILNIDPSSGDIHNGEGTSVITFSNHTKLIYKPCSVSITNSYNKFIDWVSFKLDVHLKTFAVLCRKDYGWIEFVNNDPATTKDEIQEYYYKCGILLATTLILGSKDYHRENVISCGSNPVIIDHETIVQPFIDNESTVEIKQRQKLSDFTVLESALICNNETAFPIELMGFGPMKFEEHLQFEKRVVNPNTINSKRITKIVSKKNVEKNVPIINGEYSFACSYRTEILSGFSKTYDILLYSKVELLGKHSPLNVFKNQQIRYVWRPSFVYFNILKYLRNEEFQSDFEKYNVKLISLLSFAYKNANMNKYDYILQSEIRQMQNGNIPIFSLGTENLILEGENTKEIFEYNAVENIKTRIRRLSIEHKNEQSNYINKYLNL